MANIDLKLDSWKNKLLDLGKRNRLINYKETKRSSLKIVRPDIQNLWQDFVVNEIPIEFPYYREDLSSNEEENNDGAENKSECQNGLKTNQTVLEQYRTLKSLREKAKTATEELGVNILYLSFGFLKWNESDNSEQYLMSPLVLVPASLKIESIYDPYILELHEDEIIVNPTLKFKLENDFGLILPEIDEERDLLCYFKKVRNQISKYNWELVEDASLSLLSFLKINMYRDIEKNKDKIKDNSIIRAISGDPSAINFDVESVNNFDHDKETKPIDVFQVVDADSSQQDAIVSAKKGISFVLQGPPGTGKSQTITNIIAESIADGKKVLFVSEKMAALDVVHRRLTSSGLDDFCLTMHSHKANKKEILEQLRKVIDFTRNSVKIREDAYQKLDLLQTDKEKLNTYVQNIHCNVQPLGKSIYEVNGILANLDSIEDLIFGIPNVIETTTQTYNRYINLLNKYIHTIGNMTDDYKSNPWYSANVTTLTNELRHDISSNLNLLVPKIRMGIEFSTRLENSLNLDSINSFTKLKSIPAVLELASKSPLVPVCWITENDLNDLFREIDEYSFLKENYNQAKEYLFSVYQKLEMSNSSILNGFDQNLLTSTQIEESIEKWAAIIARNSSFDTWDREDNFESAKKHSNELFDKLNNYKTLRENLLKIYENEIFMVDYQLLLTRFRTDYTSIFRIFKKQYKEDRKEILGKCKTVMKKVEDSVLVETLTKLKRVDELEHEINQNSETYRSYFFEMFNGVNSDLEVIGASLEMFSDIKGALKTLNTLLQMAKKIETNEMNLKAHYEGMYNGFNTDWIHVKNSLEWANQFKKVVSNESYGKAFIQNICCNNNKVEVCSEFALEASSIISQVEIEYAWFMSLFDEKEPWYEADFGKLIEKMHACQNNLASLEEWIDFRNAQQSCINEGLGEFVSKIKDQQLETNKIIPVFKKRFYRLWLDAVLPQFPEVLNFRRKGQEYLVDEFAKLDREQLEISKARIKKRLIESLPNMSLFTNGADEISILKKELRKQRRIMPIRKLFSQIPNLLLTLKPCLMMSPLSVSIFLESDSYEFDLIIFDEASQINTENAIGAISRGKQVIIAGDSKQLPPTNFFSASVSDDDYDDEDETNDLNAYESILDEANLLPERTLLWHYRSRHEHLIAFSNAKIYNNKLVTFPSNVEKVRDNGVEYVYVSEGFYDRGGKKGNTIEAQKIAEMVFDHFKRYPSRSLGVIAFGEVQQQAIDAAVRHQRMNNQTFEHFFSEDKDESFFIKNLENVQGDERDTIIFSIGYAKPPQGGQMHMNFGPLSKSGGERRLNVAITRAKHNVKLVGSILPTDIDINRVTSDGPKLLRSYIEFAMNGPSALLSETTESNIIEHDSAFEEAVFNFLDRNGFKVATQIGCSGYRIDLAVKHPTHSGKYILGIECDGASYHSARTARERDRLRQSVLENMGWNIYRIWSTDWIKDPVSEGQKLIEAVESALLVHDYSEDESPNNDGKNTFEETEDRTYLTLDFKESTPKEDENPYKFETRVAADFTKLPLNDYGQFEIKDCVMEIISAEFPVHYDVICKQMATFYGFDKITPTIRMEVEYALDILESKITRTGDFYVPKGEIRITPVKDNARPIDHISKEELAEAIYYVAKLYVGATVDSLCSETAKSYGFKRKTEKVNKKMMKGYDHLLLTERVKEVDGKVILQ